MGVKDFSPDYKIEQVADFSMITFSDQVSEKYFEHSDLETITNLKKDYANLFSFTDCQHMNIKKWRYAVCNRPISQNYLSNDVNTLFLVGDYLGPKETTSLERTIRSSEAIFSLLEHH